MTDSSRNYIGVTVVVASEKKKDEDPGYIVSGMPGLPPGQSCWIAKAEFEHYHTLMAAMPFGLAMESLRRGCCIYRSSWPVGTYLHLQTSNGLRRPRRYISRSSQGKTMRLERVWSPSTEDMLACDWTVGTHTL